MPIYPSSLYKNVRRGGLGLSNDPGSYLMNNYTTYQELKDVVVGVGLSIVMSSTVTNGILTPNDYNNTNLYNSKAKYPTDIRIGTNMLTDMSDTWLDFTTAVDNLQAALTQFETNSSQINTDLLKTIAGTYVGQFMNKLQFDMEKMAYRFNILNNNIDRLDDGNDNIAGGAMTATGRYPSSKNRFTITAGGQ